MVEWPPWDARLWVQKSTDLPAWPSESDYVGQVWRAGVTHQAVCLSSSHSHKTHSLTSTARMAKGWVSCPRAPQKQGNNDFCTYLQATAA